MTSTVSSNNIVLPCKDRFTSSYRGSAAIGVSEQRGDPHHILPVRCSVRRAKCIFVCCTIHDSVCQKNVPLICKCLRNSINVSFSECFFNRCIACIQHSYLSKLFTLVVWHIQEKVPIKKLNYILIYITFVVNFFGNIRTTTGRTSINLHFMIYKCIMLALV